LSASTDHAAPARCENCGTCLQGTFCHVCGQHAHNPLRHFGHAVEDVFESFWHLDGRVFRTLAELFAPGKVAANYLAGHRVRYLAPLRLFIVLSLLTFFVGKLTLHFEPGEAINVDAGNDTSETAAARGDASEIGRARNIEELMQARAAAVASLNQARRDPDSAWLMAYFGGFAQRDIDARARARMRELGATPAQQAALERAIETDRSDAAVDNRTADFNAGSATATGAAAGKDSGTASNPGAAATPAESEPPGWLHEWFQQRLTRLRENAELIEKKPDEFVRLVLGAAPGALFLLMPLFALCLKLAYWRTRRGYLEHLVVALYSHSMLLLALLMSFLLIGLQGWLSMAPWVTAAASLAVAALLSLAMPLYLLWMQKRVYAQSWLKTLLKFALLGSVYSVLLGFAVVYAVLAGLSA
jgi:hypothetical protein